MKFSLGFVLLCLAVSSASALPSYGLASFSALSGADSPIQDEAPITDPPGYMSWVLTPTTVRAAILAAVTATGIPPPINGYIANAAANRAIRALHLEAVVLTTTPAPGSGSMVGNAINQATDYAKTSAANTAGKATELAVSTAMSAVVGHTIGDYIARVVGNQVAKSLGGNLVQVVKESDAEHKQTWAEWAAQKVG